MSPQTSERILKYDDGMTAAIRADHTYASSEVSRNSAAVFDAAEQHPIRVTRRDGDDLVLMSHARGRRVATACSNSPRNSVRGKRLTTTGTLAQRLADRLPWMLALSPAGQAECASELVAAARASFATNQAHLAVAAMTSWRETAIALAAGLGSEPVEWLPDGEVVERF